MSAEFEIGGHAYRCGKLSAKKQLHVARRISPLLMGLAGSGILSSIRKEVDKGQGADPKKLMDGLTDESLGMIISGVLGNLASLPEADVDYVIDSCLAVTQRQQAGGGWQGLMTGNQLQFQDLDLPAMLKIVWEVLRLNLSGFFGEGSLTSSAGART